MEYFYCCLILEVTEKSPESLVDLNLGPCDILEYAIFTCIHCRFDFESIKYQISSENL